MTFGLGFLECKRNELKFCIGLLSVLLFCKKTLKLKVNQLDDDR